MPADPRPENDAETDLDPGLGDADLAAELVRRAGTLALGIRASGPGGLRAGATQKTGASDVVTAADLAAERYVVGQLRRCRPLDSIVGEEGGGHTGTSGRTWVIDPVDGTFNFFSGSSYWCSALALCEESRLDDPKYDAGTAPGAHGADTPAGPGGLPQAGELADAQPLLGAVYQPEEDKLWLGGPDLPATLNGVPVHVDPRQDVGRISAGTYLHPAWVGGDQAGRPWENAARLPATLRMLGSGSCDLARVAQGELGAWFQHSCPAWDWLPGKAIVRAAGGDTAVVRVNGLDWFVAGPAGAVAAIVVALRAGKR